jgi:hypothetical protein
VVRMDADGIVLARWQAAASGAAGWTRVEPGWTQDLPFGHGLAPAAGEWLQVRVVIRVRDGGERTARLFAPVRIEPGDGRSG